MYSSITGVENNKDVYIKQSYRKENGKTSSKIHRKLGKYNDLLDQFSGNHDALMGWAKAEAQKDTLEYNDKTSNVSVSLSRVAYIPKDQERCFQLGYLFLQKLCSELQIGSICRKISKRHKYTYDFNAILTDLIFSRILSPSGKLSSYAYCRTLLEPPKYELQNVYRVSLSWQKNLILFRKNCTGIQISFIPGIKRFFTMTVRIITLRLNRMMLCCDYKS